jgi:hypothetical protein
MTAQVIYLNRWLNCPDDILRRNYQMQETITLEKINFWKRLRDQNITGYQARLCYDRWINSNRHRLHIVKTRLQLIEEYDFTEPDPA